MVIRTAINKFCPVCGKNKLIRDGKTRHARCPNPDCKTTIVVE